MGVGVFAMSQPFKIFIADTNVDSGSVPISWCCSKELLDFMLQRKIADPQVLIVVSPEDIDGYHNICKEQRFVVSLKDMAAFVSFRYPGKNRIFASVIFGNKKETKYSYLNGFGKQYKKTIFKR